MLDTDLIKTRKYTLHKGQRFGLLTLLREADRNEQGKRMAECLCDCGKTVFVLLASICSTNTRSCGCNSGGRKHCMCKSKAYSVWRDMNQRCANPNNVSYPYYGALGITVCERWKSFVNFHNDMGDPPKGLQINRINNKGNYEPGNCNWATRSSNMTNQNKRRSAGDKAYEDTLLLLLNLLEKMP